MENHTDRAKFLMSEERKQWHNPETILKCADATKGMTMADLGSGPGLLYYTNGSDNWRKRSRVCC